MRSLFSTLGPSLALFFALLPSSAPAVVADRILAVVNRDVIALSDVQKHRELFMEKRGADNAEALNDLIDHKLLLAESRKLEVPPPSDDEVAAAYKKLRNRFGRSETFNLLTSRLSLTDEAIRERIKQQLLIQHLIEQRIYFFVFVTPEEIETYLQEHPGEFKNQNPDAARKTIQGIRITEKARQKLKDYLGRLRARADIRINRPPPE